VLRAALKVLTRNEIRLNLRVTPVSREQPSNRGDFHLPAGQQCSYQLSYTADR
jgi:hypothetical protein